MEPVLPDIFIPVVVAVITSLVTVYIGSKKINSQSSTQITVAEITDQAAFRAQLMTEISDLKGDLRLCKEEHAQANIRIARLERILRDHKIALIPE